MAARFSQFPVTATATSLSTIFSFSPKRYARQIDIKLAGAAVNNAYVGPSTVTNVPANAGVELTAGQAWSDIAPTGLNINTDEVFVVGTANAANILFITVVE